MAKQTHINFFNTYIHPSAFKNVSKILSSTFLSEGKQVQEFEKQLNLQIGLKNPVAVNSGTSAIHLALILAGVGPGDEVILPAQTFVATGTTILQEKAIPVFADINYDDGNINVQSIEKKITKKTKAIIVVHWGGYPCDMDEINKIAKRNKLAVIEDGAHALGALYKNKPIGSISDYTCFSFQAIKHLTTGDGGAICCKNISKHKEAVALRWFGIDRAGSKPSNLGERKYDIKKSGYKYHLNDFSASLGLANLTNFNTRLAKRRLIAQKYKKAFKDIAAITLFKEKNDRLSAYWLFGMHVKNRHGFIEKLKNHGIPTSVVHLGIDHNSCFGGTKKELTNQLKFNQTQINIPIHDNLSKSDVDYIIKIIKNGW
jgi:perosamine synthetase